MLLTAVIIRYQPLNGSFNIGYPYQPRLPYRYVPSLWLGAPGRPPGLHSLVDKRVSPDMTCPPMRFPREEQMSSSIFVSSPCTANLKTICLLAG